MLSVACDDFNQTGFWNVLLTRTVISLRLREVIHCLKKNFICLCGIFIYH